MNYEVLSCDSVSWSHAFLIRSFEERLLKLFSEGKLFGTVHTASAGVYRVAVAASDRRDKLVSTIAAMGITWRVPETQLV